MGVDICVPTMKVGCVIYFSAERTCRTSDNERLSRGRVIRETVTILWVLLDMPADRLVYFEDIKTAKTLLVQKQVRIIKRTKRPPSPCSL